MGYSFHSGLLGRERYFSQPVDMTLGKGHFGYARSLELVFVNDRQSSRIYGIIAVVPAPVKVIVLNDNGITPIADRTPTDGVVAPVPVDPCRTPRTRRDPVPSQTETPVPSAVVADTPSPTHRGNPGPTAGRVPQPSSIVVGAPGVVIDMRNPDITVGGLINPSAVVGKL